MAIGLGAALLGSAIIGGGSSLLSAGKASSAAKNATALQKEQFDTVNAQQAPWREIGGQSINLLSRGISGGGAEQNGAAYVDANPDIAAAWADPNVQSAYGGDKNAYGLAHYQSSGQTEGRQMPTSGQSVPDFLHTFGEADFRADPGYQFRLNEGMRATQGSAAARGALNSGGTLKALTRYAQGTADQTYNDAFNRYQTGQTNVFNRLASLAGLGQTANQQTAAAGQNYANQAGANGLYAAGQQGQAINNIGGIGQNLLTQFASGGSGYGGYTPMTAQSAYGFGDNAFQTVAPFQTGAGFTPTSQALPAGLF